jgi:chemotaxis protein CheD
MNNEHCEEVKIGELRVTNQPENLITSGVGSCLVIALHEPKGKIGGLAHALLPADNGHVRDGKTEQAKYVDRAIEEMVSKIKSLGADMTRIEARLIGGANMFPSWDAEDDIGATNVLVAKKKLKEKKILLIGESVGGSVGRTVEFCVASGIVTVKVRF